MVLASFYYGLHMGATLWIALGLTFPGSGGATSSYPAKQTTSPTGSRIAVLGNRKELEQRETVKSPPMMVSEIKASFGLNVTQLARILQVERQTVYLWMDESGAPRIQPRKWERLKAIHAIAAEWNGLCNRPVGKWLDSRKSPALVVLKRKAASA